MDQYSGRVLRIVDSRKAPLGTKIINFTEPIHTGNVLGWPSTVAVFLATAALAAQAVTGFLIWWRPRRRTPAEEKEEAEAGVAVA